MLMNDFKEESCTSRLLQLLEGRKQKRKVELNEEKNGKKKDNYFLGRFERSLFLLKCYEKVISY